jgi:hypothetical protein
MSSDAQSMFHQDAERDMIRSSHVSRFEDFLILNSEENEEHEKIFG